MDNELEKSANELGHETTDASVKSIIFSGLGLALATVAVCFLVLFVFKLFSDYDVPGNARQTTPVPVTPQQGMVPGPHLQDDPTAEIDRLRSREREILDTYGWVNKKNNVVRIPIDRAMDKLLEQGLPVRKQDATK